MGFVGLGLKFGMELNTNEPRVVFDFDDFHEISVRVDSRYDESCGFEILPIGIVEFEAVSVAFGNFLFAIGGMRESTFFKGTWACAQAHGGTLVLKVFLVIHDVNHRVGRVFVELFTVGFFKTQ